MISSLLHLVGLRPRVYYTLINFRGGGGGKAPLAPPPSIRQWMSDSKNKDKINILDNRDRRDTESGWDLVIIKLIHIDTYISLIVVVVTLQ